MLNRRADLCSQHEGILQSAGGVPSGDVPQERGSFPRHLISGKAAGGERGGGGGGGGGSVTISPEFVSPVTNLTLKLKELNTSRHLPRRRLSLETNGSPPSPMNCYNKLSLRLSPEERSLNDEELSDNSPFLHESKRCAAKLRSSVVRKDCLHTKHVYSVVLPESPAYNDLSTMMSLTCTRARDAAMSRTLNNEANSLLDHQDSEIKGSSFRVNRAINSSFTLDILKADTAAEVIHNASTAQHFQQHMLPDKRFVSHEQSVDQHFQWPPCSSRGFKQLMCSPIYEQDESKRASRSDMGSLKKCRRVDMNENKENWNNNDTLLVAHEQSTRGKENAAPVSHLFALSRNGGGLKRSNKEPDAERVLKAKRRRSDSDWKEYKNSNTDEEAKASGVLGDGVSDSSTPVLSTSALAVRQTIVALNRSQSEVRAKSALSFAGERHDLIGDLSRPYSLKIIKGKHPDLKAISVDMLAQLINESTVDTGISRKFAIIDCRYPYEYAGGHIRDSINVYREDDIAKMLEPPSLSSVVKPPAQTILIFHCEFSSKRGPRLMHLLRKHDRKAHEVDYPTLEYPELYLLEGGYKAFYDSYPMLCDPAGYKPMAHNDHLADLKKFRIKSKSWAGEQTVHGSSRCMSMRRRPSNSNIP